MGGIVFGLLRGISATALILSLAMIAMAQFRAGIQGVVSDANGASVPGARVTLTDKATNQSQSVIATSDGFYRFSALAPGTYSISVEKENFSKTVIDDVKVDAEAIKGQDVVLQAGAITEVVTVEAEGAPLQTEDASIRRTVTTQEIQRLPQIGRDPYELIRLTPGIVG